MSLFLLKYQNILWLKISRGLDIFPFRDTPIFALRYSFRLCFSLLTAISSFFAFPQNICHSLSSRYLSKAYDHHLPSELGGCTVATIDHPRCCLAQGEAALERLVRRPKAGRPFKIVAAVVILGDTLQRDVQLLVSYFTIHVVHATRLEGHHVCVASEKYIKSELSRIIVSDPDPDPGQRWRIYFF